MDLKELRDKIDVIDFQLLKMLDKRMEIALRLKRYKKNILDKTREDEVIEHFKSFPNTLFSKEFSGKILDEIMKESKRVQHRKQKLVGFQGEHGAYSEIAARRFNKEQIYIPHREFKDVLEGVEKGSIDYGIVPVENSLGGAVTQVNDLLIKTDLNVVAEVKLKIGHCLLTLPGVEYKDIKDVYSHPQALSQCRNFLKKEGFESKPFYDTAGSAKMLSESDLRTSAVIANDLCAYLYNLNIIKENVQDDNSNITRFVVFSKEKPEFEGNKTSIIIQTAHTPGSLFSVLKTFAEANINLTRIESVSMIDKGLNYAFFIDFTADSENTEVQKTLDTIRNQSSMFKILGTYMEADIGLLK